MDFKKLAEEILAKTGGKDNVSYATHCITRLRLTVKDKGLIKDDEIKTIPGVIGTQFVGSQYQVIIGQEVEHVYNAVCELGGFEKAAAIDENLDKKPLTVKGVLGGLMDAISGSVAPILPIITAAGLIKLIVAVLGSTMLGVVADDAPLLQLLTVVGDAGFYFFPVYLAYASAKKFGANIAMALFMAGVLIHPTLVGILTSGVPFNVYGIPAAGVDYTFSFLPIIMIVYVQSYVEKLLNKYVPSSLKSLLVPLCTMLVMLPLALCCLGPIGSWVANGLAAAIGLMKDTIGPVATGIVAALWPFLIATGMHQGLIVIAITSIMTVGFDATILVGAVVGGYALYGVSIANILKLKNNDERGLAVGNLITLALGGISEPSIFGLLLRNKRAALFNLIGAFCGGLYAGLTGVVLNFPGATNLLAILSFSGANPSNLVNACVGGAIALVVALVLSLVLGLEDKKA